MQLASPALPVGAYTYSQGMEWAVEQGWIRDEATALAWVEGILRHPMAGFEAPMLATLQRAANDCDTDRFRELNDWFIASRETGELRAETVQMGYSLFRLALALGEADFVADEESLSFPAVWALLANRWQIDESASVGGYLWSWSENQVMAAIKLVPLGQTAGQRLLWRLGGLIPDLARAAIILEEPLWNGYAPGVALASSGHETQYCRLFRS
ncbi:MAG: urease accessory protein UreF [Magnetococcales bacterium]|nr:urease accessory protein UreF [Magnetococcales bacterium]